ncbi:MAG: sulfotransferase [Gammaproteobacteria bacterium]|nr:sulfotransferase [Gammaproteobacteria bacterium]MBV9695922.1 sulfotransferase [Gammaproteobacteria bacterium]
MLRATEHLGTGAPAAREELLCRAVAQRFLGHVAAALESLRALEQQHPHFSRLFEERGRCYVVLRSAPEAIAAFRQALALNPSLPASWEMLAGLHRLQGEPQEAARAAQEAAALRALPTEVVAAAGLFADGELEPAEQLTREYLLRKGDHIEAQRLLARIGIAHKVYVDAQILLAAVLERAPDYDAAREEYAFVLVEMHRYQEALQQLEQLLARRPHERHLLISRAAALIGIGEHEQALTIYRDLLSGAPRDAEVNLSIGHALKTLGRTAEAIDSYRRAAEIRPDFGDAYWSMANLKTYRFTDQEVAEMRVQVEHPDIALADRYHLCFALGKALEDRGDYAESFRRYEQGNALKKPECRYRAELIETNTAQQIKVCTREFLAARAGWGDPRRDPIFIIGLPRAGSTLVEQILASHSQVDGTQELPNVQQLVTRLRGFRSEPVEPRYPRILETLSAADFAQLGAEYLEGTRPYRRGRPFFIDKMPNNFRHLGLIHLMLPNARFIDARREPMACCFSNFKQLFANGQEFTYSLEDIARYYRTYLELMAHWQQVLPGSILRLQHEDVVEDLEGSVRRLLAFCGLEFEPQCVAFHENRRSVRTASSEQVRRPINREGLEQWKHFEPWLAPLRNALGDATQHYRDERGA